MLVVGLQGVGWSWAQPAGGSDWPEPPSVSDTQLLALVLKLLKMATGMRALLDTVVQALPQVAGQLPPGGHYRRHREDKASLTVIHSVIHGVICACEKHVYHPCDPCVCRE